MVTCPTRVLERSVWIKTRVQITPGKGSGLIQVRVRSGILAQIKV